MKITTVFKTETDAPITGLTPLITINDITDINTVSTVITAQSMIDIGSGFYAYIFSTYEQGKEYSVFIDADSEIENRYQYDTLQKIDEYEFLNDLDTSIEENWGIKEMMRVMFSVLANKSAGGGTNTITFRTIDDSKNRITAIVDNFGNRTDITLDGD